jgi:polysaccharide export outer membrane protein
MNLSIAVGLGTFFAAMAAIQDGGSVRSTSPSTMRSAATPEYVVGIEDVIEVFVWKEPTLSTTAVVRPDGKVSLPLVGELEAGGNTVTALQEEIASKLERFLVNPQVNVIVKEVNSPKVSVLGKVREPNLYPMRHRMTLLEAIAIAGGFTEFAKQDRVMVIRNAKGSVSRIRVNVERMVKEGEDAMFYLEPFDVVYVE